MPLFLISEKGGGHVAEVILVASKAIPCRTLSPSALACSKNFLALPRLGPDH